MKVRKGFTLVELLVVVLILGALAAIAIPRISQSADSAKRNACKTNVDLINSQIELFYANTGDWPANLNAIVGNEDYFPDGAPVCPFGDDYDYDGGDDGTHRVAEHNH
ncbi:MAG: prepilin-type N-terminal cleavage/methylation domain-containing protein [Sedimentisphaerales bacterium]|nr:prepilin-type N-terminal cleavage/methylation domain-containing protein [Sedimentisphaerales bacterium]